MIPDKKWLNQFKKWRTGECDDTKFGLLLKRSKKLGVSKPLIQDCLAEINPLISKDYLDPELLPIKLLLQPKLSDHTENGVNWMAVQHHHHSITQKQQLIDSGLLNEVLQGKQQLYEDLPAIPIDAYQNGLKKRCRTRCKLNNWSIFEHLVSEGWTDFKNKREVALGFDRYNYRSPELHRQRLPLEYNLKQLLVVVGGSEERARYMALEGDWTNYLNIEATKDGLSDLQQHSRNYDLISFVNYTDELREDSKEIVGAVSSRQLEIEMITSDEALCWNEKNFKQYSNRQCKGLVTPFRLLTRCCVGGLVSIKGSTLSTLVFREGYNSFKGLVIDKAFQIYGTNRKIHQCQEVLLFRSARNPTVPEHGWPIERSNLTINQKCELFDIVQSNSVKLLDDQGFIETDPLHPGCQIIKYRPQQKPLISIVIPYRDLSLIHI